jgi:hypothetical protein
MFGKAAGAREICEHGREILSQSGSTLTPNKWEISDYE